MMKCEVIKDLLPLYIDNVCSRESAELVEEHLAACGSCRSEWENMRSELRVPQNTVDMNRRESHLLEAMSAYWSRSKLKSFLKGGVLASLSLGIVISAYFGLTEWNIMRVPADIIEVKDTSQMKDGRIAFHMRLTDGYDLNQISYDMDENGNFYMIPYRPIIKKKPITTFGLFNMYQTKDPFINGVYQNKYGADAKITALYLGTRDENILIWEEGMKLPPASDTVEAELKR
ncbi:zf-HC2 domain-containing protein [Paenibacillus sp. LHD-38]|uniref:zf-HC2 domain-containing protein n=1 Tax=Paenibacillus sp. LHD-38 TaxID=3072143 RepID=UPI00280D0688|nr:zf-HC2 domain-containing protein [Paenibacillus sp. LHD-38]MDQ8738179.1 zf-HC2 domain-containing protein [Paenibacillus sp. LHD-38]